MQLVDSPGSAVGQIDSPFVQERERVGGGLRVDLPRIALQRCDTGRRGGIDAVVFAATTTGRVPGRVRSPSSEYPRRLRQAPAARALNGARARRRSRSPRCALATFSPRRSVAGTQRGTPRCAVTRRRSCWPSRARWRCGWTVVWAGIRAGQSDFKYLSQQLAVTPPFSHAANADRRVDTPQEGQPERRVTRVVRVLPPGLLRHAMGCSPIHRPVTLI